MRTPGKWLTNVSKNIKRVLTTIKNRYWLLDRAINKVHHISTGVVGDKPVYYVKSELGYLEGLELYDYYWTLNKDDAVLEFEDREKAELIAKFSGDSTYVVKEGEE